VYDKEDGERWQDNRLSGLGGKNQHRRCKITNLGIFVIKSVSKSSIVLVLKTFIVNYV